VLQVFVDGVKLGGTILNVLDVCEVAVLALTSAMVRSPVKMIAKLLNLDEGNVDFSLSSLLRSQKDLFQPILRFGDPEGTS